MMKSLGQERLEFVFANLVGYKFSKVNVSWYYFIIFRGIRPEQNCCKIIRTLLPFVKKTT